MTPQEIFDTVATHLRTQGRKAMTSYGKCSYRIYDETSQRMLKCAVGCLISDEAYTADMETKDIHSLCNQGYKIPEFFFGNRWLLYSLQIIHDSSPIDVGTGDFIMAEVEERLQTVARERGLNYSAP